MLSAVNVTLSTFRLADTVGGVGFTDRSDIKIRRIGRLVPPQGPLTDPPGDRLAEIANVVDHCGEGRERPNQSSEGRRF
jgi:hypothetical protein